LVCGDLDNDGGLDMVVMNAGGPALVLRNTAADRGHWLIVRAVDPRRGGRDAYGAVVGVRAASRRWERVVQPASGFLTSHDPRAHFGLGDAARIDAIDVLWPDGSAERFPGVEADRIVTVSQGEGSTP
jgi:hypothetical protein